LAVKYHPDKAGGDKAKFQEINEAHGILSDEKKRQQYDMMRK
jgi:DnaJ-class molecular chaperone